MTDRDKLIGLTSSYFSGYRVIDMVDYLIANGVTVQKHGQWKTIGMRPVGTRNTHYCSLCGCHGMDEMQFCPGCGALMDLEE